MAILEQVLAAEWLLVLGLAAIYAANQTHKYHRLRHFKGPFGTGWSEIPHIRAILSHKSHLWYKNVTDRYGKIARIGPNDLLTSSPEVLSHMSAVRSPYTRTSWYNRASRVEPGRDHIFSQCDEDKHTKRRQQMAAGYSGKENTDLEPTIDIYVSQLLALIKRKYLSNAKEARAMDLAKKIQYLTLDVIAHVGFGQAFGNLARDEDVDGYIRCSEQGIGLLAFVCAIGFLPFLQWAPIARLIGPKETDKEGHGKMMVTARRLIDDRIEKGEMDRRSDMLAAFMRHGLTREDLFTESFLQIIAGSDTTATAIRGTMLYVLSNPRVYNKLREEIDDAVAEGRVGDGIVSDAQAKEMPYLQAVLREGFRIHPPVTDIAPKKVPPGGDTVIVDGESVILPGNANIGYSVFGLNHDTSIFGPDADQFRPERWLINNAEDEKRVAEMRKTTELIFGYGKYQCLGKNIAWMEYSKVIFELLRHFDWATAKPETPWKEMNYIGIFVHEEQWVIITER
ncbi:cytochrome P450 [Lophiotrema nucula]|uniref:Cytochrome P450 monooxygenase ABA1 n=1 Tax=Lophiotrema nucula TaxID=690887 RepID=A0A6A5YWW2_9PLEO|nr:cytochrome P450 [Lophiotrema nucula]